MMTIVAVEPIEGNTAPDKNCLVMAVLQSMCPWGSPLTCLDLSFQISKAEG